MKKAVCQVKYFEVDDLRLTKSGKYAKIIELEPASLFTRNVAVKYTGVDPERDILKVVAVDCGQSSGAIGIGLVKGFGLTRGAIASSLTQGGECVVAVGKSDEDITSAIRRVATLGRGAALVCGGMMMADLPLLKADRPDIVTSDRIVAFAKAAEQLGCRLADPLAALCLLTIKELPELRITTAGLFDPIKGEPVSLFE
jgi:adenine deaminase